MKIGIKDYEKNISVFYLYSGFGARLIAPIVVLFLLNKGLSFTQIMLLQSINSISIFLLEVPTGAIADLVGRKWSLMLSSIMMVLGLTVYVVTSNFYIFIVAEIMFALGLSLKSGADSALIYDSLKELGRAKEYAKIQGRAQFYGLIIQTVGSVIIGYLYSVNVNLPYIVSIIMITISAIAALFFKEARAYGEQEKPSYFNQVKEGGTYVLHHKKVRAIIIYSVFIYVFWRIGFWYYQPYMKAVSIDPKYFGMMFAMFNLAAAISSRRAHSIIRLTKDKSLILLSVLFLSSFLLMGMTRIFIGALFILPQEIARGLKRPILLKYMNENIPSNQRATIISFKSLIENVMVAIAYPIVGMLVDHVDIVSLHTYTGLTVLLGIMGLYTYLNRYLALSTTTQV